MARLPKLMIVGPGRAGKDEAGEYLASITPLRFAGTTSKFLLKHVAAELGMDETECYARRHDMREKWYAIGRKVREQDPGVLVRESLAVGEIVGGVRDREEVEASRNENLVDLVVWIDNYRVAADPTLCFGPDVCDLVIPNHRGLADYHERLRRFAAFAGLAERPPRKEAA